MALTSEEVVAHGGQVVEHINTLSEQMNKFHTRLGHLSSSFDEISQQMVQSENDIQQSIETLSEAIKGDWKQEVTELGENLLASTEEPTLENLTNAENTLESHFSAITESNLQVLEQWQNWRQVRISPLIDKLERTQNENALSLEILTKNASEDFETVNESTSYIATQFKGFTEQAIDLNGRTIDKVNGYMDDYKEQFADVIANNLVEMIIEGFNGLSETQSEITYLKFRVIESKFGDVYISEMLPLVDKMALSVSNTVDDMLSKVKSIDEQTVETSFYLDAVAGMLEKLQHRTKNTINRVQNIHDTVEAFL